MSNTPALSPQADRMIRAAAHNLIHLAALHDVLPTLETQPRQPLAMGNHGMRFTLRPVRHPDPAAADKCRAPHVLEKLSYHEGARYDMSLEDCLSYLANGWKETPGRSYTQLVLQLAELLAAAPAQPYCYSDCQAYTHGIEAELQALRKKVATYEARDALGWLPPSALATIEQALRDYHFALDSRQHGGIAADQALNTIAQAMGMRWKQGEEAARRAAQLEQQDKAA